MAKLHGEARSFTNRGDGKITGLFPSRKNGEAIAYESLHERDFLLHLEFAPDVATYAVQPEQMVLWIDGRSHTYTPDVRAERADRSHAYFEVKSDEAFAEPDCADWFAHIGRHFDERGEDFAVVTTSTIRRGFLIDNLRLLYRYSDWPVSASERERILDHLLPHSATTLGALRDHAEAAGANVGALYSLLFHRGIAADLEGQRIARMLRVWRGG